MSAPTVSILIPTRDRWARLSRTLASALAQEDVAVEAIVVADGALEETRAGIAALGDGRVELVPGRGRGVSDARNLGIERARGAWVAFLDDDDLWSPRKLWAQLDAAERAGAVFAYSSALPVDDELRVLPGSLPSPPPAEDIRTSLILSNCVPAGCSNVVGRSDVVKGVEGFDPRFAQVADWDMWLQLAEAGPAVALDEVHVAYVQHPESMLLGDEREPFAEFRMLREKHSNLARSLGVGFSEAMYARWVATRHRRTGKRVEAARMLLRSAAGFDRAYLGNVGRALLLLAGGEDALARGRRIGAGEGALAPPPWLTAQAGAGDAQPAGSGA